MQQDLELRCRGLNLSSAPTIPDVGLFKKLDLSLTIITFLQLDFFKGNDKLDTVIMTNAKIQKMDPGAFHPLKNLKTVDLSHNSLSAVPPELFTQNPKLQNVSLRGNPLTMQPLDPPILNSSSLHYLNLKNCKLSNLSTTSLSQVPNVLFLDLSDNRFAELSAYTLFPLSRLIYIDLRSNRWICCADFERLICFAYDKSNPQPHIMKCSTTNGKKIYTTSFTKLSTSSTSLTSITTTPTPLIDIATGMETLRSVTVFSKQDSSTGIFHKYKFINQYGMNGSGKKKLDSEEKNSQGFITTPLHKSNL
jgi:hypothetical protein